LNLFTYRSAYGDACTPHIQSTHLLVEDFHRQIFASELAFFLLDQKHFAKGAFAHHGLQFKVRHRYHLLLMWSDKVYDISRMTYMLFSVC